MQDQNMTQNDDMGPGGEGSPIDDIISSVDGFISNPKSITPQSLQQLKMDLEDLKTVLDPNESQNTDQGAPPSPGGLAAMIGGGQ